MKEKILGIDQKRAVGLGLDVVDAVLINMIADKLKSKKSEKCEIDGDVYVWVNYRSVLEWLPILGMKKRALAIRLDRLVDKGFLKKHVKKEEGNYTFFSLCHSDSKPMSTKVQRVCHSTDNPMSVELHTKSNRDKVTVIREKEKDITKVISKKKDGGDFDLEFQRFSMRAAKDKDLERILRPYNIVDLQALLDDFERRIANRCRTTEFAQNQVNDYYIKNRQWLINSLPYLDLSKATGYTLGYGEYLKDNRRLYRNRNGKEIEVPMDAPPRRQGTIWYKEQGRWGPDT